MNSVLSLPLLFVWMVARGETQQWAAFPHWSQPAFLVSWILSILLAVVLNYSVFLNVSMNSPLTATVTGQMKNIGTTALSLYIDGSYHEKSPTYLFGVALGITGSVWYAWAKHLELSRAAKKAA